MWISLPLILRLICMIQYYPEGVQYCAYKYPPPPPSPMEAQ